MRLLVALSILTFAFRASAQTPQAPVLLRTDLLLHSDRVWQNGFLTNLTLPQADSTNFKGQLALIRSQYPSFSWVLADTITNYHQTAYQIILSSAGKRKGDDHVNVWDSGKVKSGQS